MLQKTQPALAEADYRTEWDRIRLLASLVSLGWSIALASRLPARHG